MKTLFTNACLLLRSVEGSYYALKDACLGVDGNYIAYIGKERPEGLWDAVKDMSGKLIIPGLVNAHGHAAMTLLRGVGSGLPLQRWLNEAIFPIEAKMKPEDIVAGTRWAVMEMLAGGTTLCSDMYDFPWDAAKVYEEAGMKVNTGRILLCFDPEMKAEDCERLTECEQFMKDFEGRGSEGLKPGACGLVKADVALHSEYLTTENTVRALAEMAKRYDCVVQLHVSETKSEHIECMERHKGLTPVAYLKKCGILDKKTYMAHCVWVTDEDLEIMKETGATLVHNPTSNMKLGSGFAPVAKALEKGVNVALGTDGCASNNNLNMFEEMHLAALLQKGLHSDPTLVTVDQVIDMATVNGAKALGRPDTGELKEGMRADLAVIDLKRPHLEPAVDIPALLVYSVQASDVVMTMVDGKILYDNGAYLTIDAEKAWTDYEASVTRLMGSGLFV